MSSVAVSQKSVDDTAADTRTEAPEAHSTHRQILRSSSIIGGASVVNIVIGLLRTKIAAVILGPAGFGFIGLLQSLMATASTVSGLGISSAGTRQIAEAAGIDDEYGIAAARRALFWGTLLLAAVGAWIFWALRGELALRVIGDSAVAHHIGWLAIGVALTVAAGSQNALLRGMRRIGDIARVSILSALLSTALGIAALWIWGSNGILIFVLATPAATFALGHLYVARIPRVTGPPTPLSQLAGQWRVLATLGFAFMIAGIAGTVGQLAVRTVIQRQLGAEALGYFQAAWAISMTYIGFVLTAMATDYYPRLTAAIHDKPVTNRIVNEQTEVALLLAGPILLAMLGLAPLVIRLLYSSSFVDAVDILRWQILGDILKVASWPLGFVILAAGDGRTFMLTETLSMAFFVGLTWIGLPLMGIKASGVAFLAMYAGYLPAVYWLANRRTGFHWSPEVTKLVMILLIASSAVSVTVFLSDLLGTVTGLIAAGSAGWYSVNRLHQDSSKSKTLVKISRAGGGWRQ